MTSFAARFSALIKLGISFVVCSILLNAALFGLSATPALHWLPHKVSGSGFVEDNRQRAAAASEEFRSGKISATKYLCAVVGISNIREAINLEVFSAAIGTEWRVLGIGGAGAGIESVQENARALLDSDLRPDLVVLGVTPLQLLDSMLVKNLDAAVPKITTSQFTPSSILKIVQSWTWVYARRQDLSLWTQDMLLQARRAILRWSSAGIATVDPRSPWRGMLKLMGAEHYPDSTLKKSLNWVESKGAFNYDAYVSSQEAQEVFKRIIWEFVSRQAHVVVILTPEHTWLRSREPEGLNELFRKVTMGFPPQAVDFIDLRDAIDDSGFVDLVHLNNRGSAQFSELIGKMFSKMRVSHPPLMSLSGPFER